MSRSRKSKPTIDCSICLFQVESGQERTLPCGHILHKKCYQRLKDAEHWRCPNCRRPFAKPQKRCGHENPSLLDELFGHRLTGQLPYNLNLEDIRDSREPRGRDDTRDLRYRSRAPCTVATFGKSKKTAAGDSDPEDPGPSKPKGGRRGRSRSPERSRSTDRNPDSWRDCDCDCGRGSISRRHSNRRTTPGYNSRSPSPPSNRNRGSSRNSLPSSRTARASSGSSRSPRDRDNRRRDRGSRRRGADVDERIEDYEDNLIESLSEEPFFRFFRSNLVHESNRLRDNSPHRRPVAPQGSRRRAKE